jgi:hypothetical protein
MIRHVPLKRRPLHQMVTNFERCQRVLPLPGGEGRGEGERGSSFQIQGGAAT